MRFLLCLTLIVLSACASTAASIDVLPEGDASRGAELFSQTINGAPACSTCHTLNSEALVGPSLQGFGLTAETRITDMSAEAYTHQSIVQPAAYLVNGFGNIMYNQYGQRLSAQELADLTAYLLTL